MHTSDLHLESLGGRACHSLEALVNLAIKTKVDLVIVAGDLFDHNRVDESLVSFVVEQLQRLPVHVGYSAREP
ncbi:metallophosphoesterase [Chloroflexota bacterium]